MINLDKPIASIEYAASSGQAATMPVNSSPVKISAPSDSTISQSNVPLFGTGSETNLAAMGAIIPRASDTSTVVASNVPNWLIYLILAAIIYAALK